MRRPDSKEKTLSTQDGRCSAVIIVALPCSVTEPQVCERADLSWGPRWGSVGPCTWDMESEVAELVLCLQVFDLELNFANKNSRTTRTALSQHVWCMRSYSLRLTPGLPRHACIFLPVAHGQCTVQAPKP